MKKLYVIGNGFDKAHGLKTSYWDFRCYLSRYAEEFLVEFEKLYGFYPYYPEEHYIPENKQKDVIKKRNDALCDILWKCFEDSLGTPDEGEIENTCYSAVEAMADIEFGGVEDTLNEYFEKQFRFVQELQIYLLKWAKQIRLNKARIRSSALNNNVADLFLTFNYTPVLERVYGIASSQICHIHGGIPPYCETTPIIGHGNRERIEHYRELQKKCYEAFDEGGTSTNRAFANFYQRTYKDTDRFLADNMYFFSKLYDIHSVEIIGHSLGNVDIPYFEAIKRIASDEINWIVFYHSEDEKDKLENAIKSIGVVPLMKPSNDFWV